MINNKWVLAALAFGIGWYVGKNGVPGFAMSASATTTNGG